MSTKEPKFNRKFNGKLYRLALKDKSKTEAKSRGDYYRKKGNKARVIKGKYHGLTYYFVYVR